MKSVKYGAIYGFLLWLIPFIISIGIFPLKKTDPAFFQSLMTIVAVAVVVFLTVFYFKKVEKTLKEGIFLGILFLAISLAFDYFMFIWGPIKMDPQVYIKEIGIAYFIYPIITIGFSYFPLSTKSLEEIKKKVH